MANHSPPPAPRTVGRSIGLHIVLSTAVVLGLSPSASSAQLAAGLSYGVERSVESSEAELDGRLSGTVEWVFPSGLGIGLGTDHRFEAAGLGPADHLGWALYLSSSYELPLGAVAPFFRAGVGLGRAPCVSDTCGDGPYALGSGGVRIRLVDELRVSGELGVSRVGRPFSTAGILLRF